MAAGEGVSAAQLLGISQALSTHLPACRRASDKAGEKIRERISK